MIGPSGCGKSTFLRCLNRMNDTIDICRVTGEISSTIGTSTTSGSTSCRCVRRSGWCSRSRTRFPRVDLRQHRLWSADPRSGLESRRAGRDRRNSPTKAGQEEVKDRLDQPGYRSVRWPATTPVHRAHDRRGTRGHSDGRTLFGARSDRDGKGREPDRRAAGELHTIAIVTHSMQQAARIAAHGPFPSGQPGSRSVPRRSSPIHATS